MLTMEYINKQEVFHQERPHRTKAIYGEPQTNDEKEKIPFNMKYIRTVIILILSDFSYVSMYVCSNV